MKKIIVATIGILFLMGTANAQDIVTAFQKKHEKEAGFTIVNITPKMFELVSMMADGEDQGILKKLTGLKVLTSERNSDKYYKDACKMLTSSDHEELMSVADGEDNVQLYIKEKKKGIISSLIITVQEPSEFTMIGITGEIDLKELSTISKTFNIDKLDKISDTQ